MGIFPFFIFAKGWLPEDRGGSALDEKSWGRGSGDGKVFARKREFISHSLTRPDISRNPLLLGDIYFALN